MNKSPKPMAMTALPAPALWTPRWSSAVTPPISSDRNGITQRISRMAFLLCRSRLRRSLNTTSSTSQWPTRKAAASQAICQPASAGRSVTRDERTSSPLCSVRIFFIFRLPFQFGDTEQDLLEDRGVQLIENILALPLVADEVGLFQH